MSRLAAGTEPTIVDRRHSRARVFRVDSGLVISRSRRSMSRAPPQAWSLARQCQEHGASRVIALAMSQRGHVASRRGDRADYRRSPSLACARLSRRLGSCVLTVAPVVVSRAATGVVACASVPRARRLARHRAGHEPTSYVASRRGDRADYRRSPSLACARLSRRLGSCVLTVAPVDVSRAATGVVACASVPRARRLTRHRAGHEPTRPCRVSPRGLSRPSSIAVTRVRASFASTRVVCVLTVAPVDVSRAATGVVACASVPRARRLARHRAGHEPTRSMSRLAAGTEPTIVDRRHSRARVFRVDSGPVFSRSRRSMSRAPPQAWSLARQCQEHGASRVIALAMSQRDYVASRRGDRADYRRSPSLACARLSRRLGSCDLTVAPVDVSRAATGVVACASVPRARRLARHRAGHEPTRLCRVSPRGPSRLSSIAVARVRASVAPTRVL